ncbi:MAG: sodium:calcium antiporter [Limisphaerales bacterium]
MFLVGARVVIVGSRFLVKGAVKVAGGFGGPAVIIGRTALGTSLPELITAITSLRQAVSDLAVGNVLGANIANLSLIVGTAAAIHEITLERWTQGFNFPALLVVRGLLLWMLLSDRRVTRREGVILLVTYAVYLAGLVAFALRPTS